MLSFPNHSRFLATTSTALLTAAALIATASSAAAEPPLAPARDLVAMPVAVQQPTVRRNSALMISGISLVGAGLLITTVGGVMALTAHPGAPGSEDDGSEQRFKGLMIGAAGLGASFLGIPLWIIGGSSVPAKATLSIAASGASIGGSF